MYINLDIIISIAEMMKKYMSFYLLLNNNKLKLFIHYNLKSEIVYLFYIDYFLYHY